MDQTYTILAGDTGTNINTVALCRVCGDAVEILAEANAVCGRLHAERLIETVHWTLEQANTRLDAVDWLAIAVGPGSFTGLRIGVATWKGLALGAERPLIGVASLDAMVHLLAPLPGVPITVCPVLDARMGEVFGAAYRFGAGARRKVRGDSVCPVEDLFAGLEGPVLTGGDGAALYRERIAACCPGVQFAPDWAAGPRAASVAVEAAALLRAGASGTGAVNPVYLRKSQAEMNRDLRAAAEAVP